MTARIRCGSLAAAKDAAVKRPVAGSMLPFSLPADGDPQLLESTASPTPHRFGVDSTHSHHPSILLPTGHKENPGNQQALCRETVLSNRRGTTVSTQERTTWDGACRSRCPLDEIGNGPARVMVDLSHPVPQLFDDIAVGLPECLEMVRREFAQGVADRRRANMFATTFCALAHAIGTAIVNSHL